MVARALIEVGAWSAALSPAQARFLRFFLGGPPDRAFWLQGGRRIGAAEQPLAGPEGATHVLVYRLAVGEGLTTPGEAIDRTRLTLQDLQELAPYWREPLRTLNHQGESAARTRLPKRNRVCSFRQTEAERDQLRSAAARTGLPPAVIVSELVADYLAKLPQGPKTPIAENNGSQGR